MKCPRCIQRIHRAADLCPHCGYSIEEAEAIFGSERLVLRRLSDAAGIFRRDERQKLQANLEQFSRNFPQLFMAIYTGSLGEVTHLRQFGFWLLNRSRFEDVEKSNENGILLTIDPESKTAGIVFGYLLDPFLDESDTFECLSRAHPYWLEGRYVEGIRKLLKHLGKILRKRSRQAKQDPEPFQRKVLPSAQVGDLVRRIRAENQETQKISFEK